MKIPLAALADEANVSQEGKLNLLGVFDRIQAAAFPVLHPRMVFAFRVQTDYGDAGRTFPVQVRMAAPGGDTLFEAVGEITGPPVPAGDIATLNQVFSLVGVELPREGMYRLTVGIAAEEAEVEFLAQVTAGEGTMN
jgi:hypothetical protein